MRTLRAVKDRAPTIRISIIGFDLRPRQRMRAPVTEQLPAVALQLTFDRLKRSCAHIRVALRPPVTRFLDYVYRRGSSVARLLTIE